MKNFTDLFLKNDITNVIPVSGSTSIPINIPQIENLFAIDVKLVCDSTNTGSKDITFKLRNNDNQYETFAFWDDSTETLFTYEQKLTDRSYSRLYIDVLNNSGSVTITPKYVHVRFYFENVG